MRDRDAGNGKALSSLRCGNDKEINSLVARYQSGILLPEGLSRFAFRVLRPGDSGAYPSGSAKSKKNQKLCALCGSAVNKFL